MDRGRPGFRRGFPCPAVLRIPLRNVRLFGYGDFTLSVRLSQNLSPETKRPVTAVLQPRPRGRFGLLRFRSPLLPESLLISFPGVLRWFSSPGLASATYGFSYGWRARARRVTPFGHRRIKGCLPLPAAFRSLPRPSSRRYATGIRREPSFRLTILSFRETPHYAASRSALSVRGVCHPDSVKEHRSKKWAGVELNYRPLPYQSSALTD